MSTTIEAFRRLTLLRVFHTVDANAGHLVRYEVRRDPTTGLTLTAPFAIITSPTKETRS